MSIRAYFFGVSHPSSLGHFLYRAAGPGQVSRLSGMEEKTIPFRVTIMDGGLLSLPETAGAQLSHINGWTILGTWDRTGDKRAGSCSSFLLEGVYAMDSAKLAASSAYPELYARVFGAFMPGTTNPVLVSS